MPLVHFAVASAAGIPLAAFVSSPLVVWLWWLVLPVGLLVLGWREPQLRLVHLSLLILLLAAIRYNGALPPLEGKETDLAFYNNRGTMLLIGNVVDPTEVRDRSVHLRVQISRVRIENVWHDASGLALIQAPRET